MTQRCACVLCLPFAFHCCARAFATPPTQARDNTRHRSRNGALCVDPSAVTLRGNNISHWKGGVHGDGFCGDAQVRILDTEISYSSGVHITHHTDLQSMVLLDGVFVHHVPRGHAVFLSRGAWSVVNSRFSDNGEAPGDYAIYLNGYSAQPHATVERNVLKRNQGGIYVFSNYQKSPFPVFN